MAPNSQRGLERLAQSSTFSSSTKRSDSLNQSAELLPRFRSSSESGFIKAIAPKAQRAKKILPKAKLIATDLTVATGSTLGFVVKYRGRKGAEIRRNTLNTGDISVTGPNGFNQLANLAGVQIKKKGMRAIATYNLVAPDGAWDATENGQYTVNILKRQVRDRQRKFVKPGALGTINVNIPNAPPTSALTSQGFSGVADYSFKVTYSDDYGINAASIDSNDVIVAGPGGFSQLATLVEVSPSSDGRQTATYKITAPGGKWDTPDNGTYTISLQANQVSDTLGVAVNAGTLGSFLVDSSAIAPTATLTPIPNAANGDGVMTFKVTYNDNGLVRRNSLDSNDILVTGPNGFSQLASLVSNGVTPNTDSSTLVATYQITPPGGTWDNLETGLYSVTLQSNQIQDSDGNFSPQNLLGTFQVNPLSLTTRLEAESFDLGLQNIRYEERSFISGGRMIRVDLLENGSVGTAAKQFTGSSGRYDIRLGYFDETDGNAQITFRIGNLNLSPVVLNQDLGGDDADDTRTYVERTIATNVGINQGDLITYTGTFDGDEASRFDYAEFVYVGPI